MGLWDLLWSHRVSCLHHHCQMGEFLSIVLSNIFSVFLLLLIILFHLTILSFFFFTNFCIFYMTSTFYPLLFEHFSPSPVLFCTLFYLPLFFLIFSFSPVNPSSILSLHSSFSATISPFHFSSPSFAPSLSSHHQINQSLS